MAEQNEKARIVKEHQINIDETVNDSLTIKRKVTYRNIRPILIASKGQQGVISFNVCVNSEGNVTYADIIYSETTLFGVNVMKKSLVALYGYKFAPGPPAIPVECGKIKVNVGEMPKQDVLNAMKRY